VRLAAARHARAAGYLVFFPEPENERINRPLGKLMNAASPEFNTDRKFAASMESDIRSFARIPKGWYASSNVHSPRILCAWRSALRPRWT